MLLTLTSPLRRSLCTSATRLAAKQQQHLPQKPTQQDGWLDGEEDDATHEETRNHELSQFLNDVVIAAQQQERPGYKYKAQSIIRPTDLHRETRKRLELITRRRPLPTYGSEARYRDIFIQLGIDPRNEADNRTLMSGFVNGIGRILPRAQSGLSLRSQRLMGKAIKRSKMMGVIPMFSNANNRGQNPKA